jgi:hypothetical protein
MTIRKVSNAKAKKCDISAAAVATVNVTAAAVRVVAANLAVLLIFSFWEGHNRFSARGL